MTNEDDDEEFQLIITFLRAMKEYVAWSLAFDGVIDTETMNGDEADEIAAEEFDRIIDQIRGNKSESQVPFTNEDAHAILDAVARWRLDNDANRPRPPGS